MNPRALMITGGALGLLHIIGASVMFDSAIGLWAFAAGALFGKGYGVWESRQPTPSGDQ